MKIARDKYGMNMQDIDLVQSKEEFMSEELKKELLSFRPEPEPLVRTSAEKKAHSPLQRTYQLAGSSNQSSTLKHTNSVPG